MTPGKLTDADKIMNPQYFGNNLVDTGIRIWINPEIRTRILVTFGRGRRLGGGLHSLLVYTSIAHVTAIWQLSLSSGSLYNLQPM